ncbi:hypothetical protein PIB30_044451 [Stylosanthes scabra]|uniref:Retrotransposon gag domain-containing protein n=1 Tax=Stylosanthes scabra TaxID=79078 RepID=A0ABU6SGB8_9FABA|nr:hypothetical protein [Stylosanthes scabra]
MGLVNGHNGRLDRLEQELAQQREVERKLQDELRWRREAEEKIKKLEEGLKQKWVRRIEAEMEIMKAEVPKNFRSRMYLAGASDATRCKAFPLTLTKAAQIWFDSLPPRSITSFEELAKKFLNNSQFRRRRSNTLRAYSESSRRKANR